MALIWAASVTAPAYIQGKRLQDVLQNCDVAGCASVSRLREQTALQRAPEWLTGSHQALRRIVGSPQLSARHKRQNQGDATVTLPPQLACRDHSSIEQRRQVERHHVVLDLQCSRLLRAGVIRCGATTTGGAYAVKLPWCHHRNAVRQPDRTSGCLKQRTAMSKLSTVYWRPGHRSPPTSRRWRQLNGIVARV